jgi:hypothetical protein
MNPRIKIARPNPDYTLTLTFVNGEVKVFDAKPYLSRGIFQELQDKFYFSRVQPFLGSIQWPHGQDFCPDTLYLDSIPAPSPSPSGDQGDEDSLGGVYDQT